MRALRAAGTAVLLVEQSVNVAVSVADRVYVMDSGAIRFSGPAADVRDHPELLWSIFLHRAAAGVTPVPGDDRRHRRSPPNGTPADHRAGRSRCPG